MAQEANLANMARICSSMLIKTKCPCKVAWRSVTFCDCTIKEREMKTRNQPGASTCDHFVISYTGCLVFVQGFVRL